MPELELKTEEIKIRVTKKVKNKLQFLADRYAQGNLSAWMEYGGLFVPRGKVRLQNKPGTAPSTESPATQPPVRRKPKPDRRSEG